MNSIKVIANKINLDKLSIFNLGLKGGSKLSTVNAYNWNNWSWNWGGTPVEDLQVGSQTNQQSGIINKVVSE